MSSTPETLGDGAADIDEAFRSIVLDVSLADAEKPNPVIELLRDHLGIDPIDAAQATHDYTQSFDRPIAQAGIDAFLAQAGRTHEIVGVLCPVADPELVLLLSKLFTPASLNWPGAAIGPATWEQLECGHERTIRCLYQGMILVRDADGPFAIWVTTSTPYPKAYFRHVTVAAADPNRATSVLEEIKRLGNEHTPYRGEMFTADNPLIFMPRPSNMSAENVILPPGLLERIDQHAVGVSRAARRLADAGQHLKRGLLLYGPPGTGKTHSIRYLVSQLPRDTSVLIIPAGRLYYVEPCLKIMGPSSVVVIDDVDYFASDRSLPGIRVDLFRLLETLDGLQSHGDVLFVLTTNRLDSLEPAVAARPGRIDEALEVPRPDAECRRRLFNLYSKGMALTMSPDEVDELVKRTEGVTAAFTKEMLRRATVVAVENGAEEDADGNWPVKGSDVFDALDEMLDPDNPATRFLLGADPEHVVQKVAVKVAGGDK